MGMVCCVAKVHDSVHNAERAGDAEVMSSQREIDTRCSDAEKATIFNEYFSSVFTVEDTTTIPTVHSVCSPPVIDSIDITPEVVLNKITNLQSGKSSGPDGWPVQIIKSMHGRSYFCSFIYYI